VIEPEEAPPEAAQNITVSRLIADEIAAQARETTSGDSLARSAKNVEGAVGGMIQQHADLLEARGQKQAAISKKISSVEALRRMLALSTGPMEKERKPLEQQIEALQKLLEPLERLMNDGAPEEEIKKIEKEIRQIRVEDEEIKGLIEELCEKITTARQIQAENRAFESLKPDDPERLVARKVLSRINQKTRKAYERLKAKITSKMESLQRKMQEKVPPDEIREQEQTAKGIAALEEEIKRLIQEVESINRQIEGIGNDAAALQRIIKDVDATLLAADVRLDRFVKEVLGPKKT
jgi:DNA repair exonuclease SbcCD ATPase subunit